MLKLLLSHWQAHREPPPFILTDDPLYCTHFSTARLPEVYSVNRINPIFEDDNDQQPYVLHKRSPSEEQRESETRSSDDTGYSSGQRKCRSSTVDLTDVGSFDRQMSSDSDEPPEALVVSADVHRVSFPDDVIVLSSSRNTFSTGSISSRRSTDTNSSLSEQPFDSLTESNYTEFSHILDHTVGERSSLKMEAQCGVNTEVKRPLGNGKVGPVRDKIQKLLEHGTRKVLDNSQNDYKETSRVADMDGDLILSRSRHDLMRSLTRALSNKVPKTTDSSIKSNVGDGNMVTRTDSSSGKSVAAIPPPPPPPPKPNSPENKSSENGGVTRQDESSLSSSGGSSESHAKKHRHRHRHKHHEKIREKSMHANDHDGREHSRLCKVCDETHKPLNLHQFLPGHWSYDNIYLPQLPRVCYHCLHHSVLPLSEDEIFHPMYYDKRGKIRHSWAPHSTNFKDNIRHQNDQIVYRSQMKFTGDRRYSPDGSSHGITEEDEERENETKLKESSPDIRNSIPERRSLRVPKKCKCEDCLSAALDDEVLPHIVPVQPCTCYHLPHRKVKFASDTDLTRHSHDGKSGDVKDKGNHMNFVNNHSNTTSMNGHFPLKKILDNKNDSAKTNPPTLNRGQKEPITVDELYRSYPMSFQEWETHFRRKFLRKRRKRALNMIGMAIGIILVVGVAIAMTFIFLRLKRPT